MQAPAWALLVRATRPAWTISSPRQATAYTSRVEGLGMSRTVRVRLSSCFCYPHVLAFFSTGRETAAFCALRPRCLLPRLRSVELARERNSWISAGQSSA